MRTIVAWSDRVPERDGVKNCVYDIAFKPDGSQLVAAVGSRVLVYDAANGDLLHSLKGHKDTLYSVAYSRDGKRFASGGADKTIIIWTSKAEGILKYSHNDSIQCLAYNPVTQQLASGTASDFGLWSPEQKSVAKHKVPSRVLCMSWTNDGTILTLGHFDGHVSLRDKSGVEVHVIERSAPIWSLQWNPSREEAHDLLAVACWDQTLAFYDIDAAQHGKDKQLGFDPTCVRHFSNGEYICVGGSDKKASLWTKEGVRLVTLAERDDWVWCCAPRPGANYVAVGCNDGTICMYQLLFSTVHGLYRERYAYRDFMTDVVVQHMASEQKLRIKCKDYVRKIAIYKERLAVQLPGRLVIYELAEHGDELRYTPREKLPLTVECNLLVLTARHFLLCHQRKLQLYGFGGAREREWNLDAEIRYVKVTGGPAGREGLVVGLADGQACRIFVDNPFPVKLFKHGSAIRCLDVSATRGKIAVVDDNSVVTCYDLKSGKARPAQPHSPSQPPTAPPRRPSQPLATPPNPSQPLTQPPQAPHTTKAHRTLTACACAGALRGAQRDVCRVERRARRHALLLGQRDALHQDGQLPAAPAAHAGLRRRLQGLADLRAALRDHADGRRAPVRLALPVPRAEGLCRRAPRRLPRRHRRGLAAGALGCCLLRAPTACSFYVLATTTMCHIP